MSLLRKTLLALSENRSLYRFILKHPLTRKMSRRFIAGETLEEAIQIIQGINADGMMATFDHLGENVSSPEEAKHATDVYLHILEEIHKAGIDSNISLKLTELGLDLDEALCEKNLLCILEKAHQFGNFIRIDMEGSSYAERTLNLFYRVFAKHQSVGIVIQAYLYRSENDIDTLIENKARVRLCKGAYNEPPSVAFPKKKEVDDNYIMLMKKLLLKGNYPGIATHDHRIVEIAKSFVKEHQIEHSKFEFQMLYGIRREMEKSLVREGYNLRIYVPYGERWYPYFMRRLAERPANLIFFLTSLLKG